MPWLETTDVQTHLGLQATDDRLDMATAAVKAEVERLRSDLDLDTECTENIRYGAVLWAAMFYQYRNAPSGFSNFGDGADLMGDVMGSRKGDIYRLIGLRRPLTA